MPHHDDFIFSAHTARTFHSPCTDDTYEQPAERNCHSPGTANGDNGTEPKLETESCLLVDAWALDRWLQASSLWLPIFKMYFNIKYSETNTTLVPAEDNFDQILNLNHLKFNFK